jgi:hypothetical protein
MEFSYALVTVWSITHSQINEHAVCSFEADGWCWFVLREKYCWLVAGGWFVLREKYCWLVADKPSEQGDGLYTCLCDHSLMNYVCVAEKIKSS